MSLHPQKRSHLYKELLLPHDASDQQLPSGHGANLLPGQDRGEFVLVILDLCLIVNRNEKNRISRGLQLLRHDVGSLLYPGFVDEHEGQEVVEAGVTLDLEQLADGLVFRAKHCHLHQTETHRGQRGCLYQGLERACPKLGQKTFIDLSSFLGHPSLQQGRSGLHQLGRHFLSPRHQLLNSRGQAGLVPGLHHQAVHVPAGTFRRRLQSVLGQ